MLIAPLLNGVKNFFQNWNISIQVWNWDCNWKPWKDKVIVDEEKELEDKSKNDTKITMEIIQEIANGINPKIQLTTDTLCMKL